MTSALTILEQSFRRIRVPVRTPRAEPIFAGVYMLTALSEIIYVGSSTDVMCRIWHHRVERQKTFNKVIWYPLPLAVHPFYEGAFIRFLVPRHNRIAPSACVDYDDEIIEGFGLDPAQRAPSDRLAFRQRFHARSVTPSDVRALHERVSAHVRNSGFSVRDIADRTGWHLKRAQRLLRGITRFKAQDIDALARVLGKTVGELHGDPDAMKLQ